MRDITLRQADPATDARHCAEIYRPFVTDSWVSFEDEAPDAVSMAQRIADYGTSHAWIVAEAGGAVVGYAYGSPHRTRAAYASSCDVAVYIDRTHLRQGVGRALYADLLPRLAVRYHAAFAGIALPNPASIALHETMGFARIGVYREVGHKLGAWRDVGWWQKLL